MGARLTLPATSERASTPPQIGNNSDQSSPDPSSMLNALRSDVLCKDTTTASHISNPKARPLCLEREGDCIRMVTLRTHASVLTRQFSVFELRQDRDGSGRHGLGALSYPGDRVGNERR